MKTFVNINGDVDQEMLNKFITLQENSEWKEIVIFFDSPGGSLHISEHIVEIIANIENCTIIAGNQIQSAWFNIFFKAKCKKEVSHTCYGMTHVPSYDNSTSPYFRKWLYKSVRDKNIVNSVKEQVKLLVNLWVSKQKIKWYIEWYDVSFTAKELRKMVKLSK